MRHDAFANALSNVGTPYAEKDVDFIDAYNAAWSLVQDINVEYTFDQAHFSRIEGITVRVPGAVV